MRKAQDYGHLLQVTTKDSWNEGLSHVPHLSLAQDVGCKKFKMYLVKTR